MVERIHLSCCCFLYFAMHVYVTVCFTFDAYQSLDLVDLCICHYAIELLINKTVMISKNECSIFELLFIFLRFGHGTFLHCLESVFEKLVGKPLTYTALMGKPSEITYTYAERLVMRQATEMRFHSPIERLYAIGYASCLCKVGLSISSIYIHLLLQR